MSIYKEIRVKCSVCGGSGTNYAVGGMYSWFGYVHEDSSICANNLAYKKKCKKEKQEKQNEEYLKNFSY